MGSYERIRERQKNYRPFSSNLYDIRCFLIFKLLNFDYVFGHKICKFFKIKYIHLKTTLKNTINHNN